MLLHASSIKWSVPFRYRLSKCSLRTFDRVNVCGNIHLNIRFALAPFLLQTLMRLQVAAWGSPCKKIVKQLLSPDLPLIWATLIPNLRQKFFSPIRSASGRENSQRNQVSRQIWIHASFYFLESELPFVSNTIHSLSICSPSHSRSPGKEGNSRCKNVAASSVLFCSPDDTNQNTNWGERESQDSGERLDSWDCEREKELHRWTSYPHFTGWTGKERKGKTSLHQPLHRITAYFIPLHQSLFFCLPDDVFWEANELIPFCFTLSARFSSSSCSSSSFLSPLSSHIMHPKSGMRGKNRRTRSRFPFPGATAAHFRDQK